MQLNQIANTDLLHVVLTTLPASQNFVKQIKHALMCVRKVVAKVTALKLLLVIVNEHAQKDKL